MCLCDSLFRQHQQKKTKGPRDGELWIMKGPAAGVDTSKLGLVGASCFSQSYPTAKTGETMEAHTAIHSMNGNHRHAVDTTTGIDHTFPS